MEAVAAAAAWVVSTEDGVCLPRPGGIGHVLLCAPAWLASVSAVAAHMGPLVVAAGMLNSVIELWRDPSAQACLDARKAARAVPEWRQCIAAVTPGVQHFSSSFLHACPFSPMQ